MLLAGQRPLGCLFGVDADLDDVGHRRASLKATPVALPLCALHLILPITTGNQPD